MNPFYVSFLKAVFWLSSFRNVMWTSADFTSAGGRWANINRIVIFGLKMQKCPHSRFKTKSGPHKKKSTATYTHTHTHTATHTHTHTQSRLAVIEPTLSAPPLPHYSSWQAVWLRPIVKGAVFSGMIACVCVCVCVCVSSGPRQEGREWARQHSSRIPVLFFFFFHQCRAGS